MAVHCVVQDLQVLVSISVSSAAVHSSSTVSDRVGQKGCSFALVVRE